MSGIKIFAVVASFCGAFAITSALAQTIDVKGDTAGQTALTERGATTNGTNSTAGTATPSDQKGGQHVAKQEASKGGAVIIPKPTPNAAGNTTALNGDESAIAPRADVANAQGPDAQAIRSAESTAHKTVYDPNDQLGTSTEGTTRPIPGVNASASSNAAEAQQ
jgi:hypothetical protein